MIIFMIRIVLSYQIQFSFGIAYYTPHYSSCILQIKVKVSLS